MKPYTHQPGTVPYKVITHLQTLQPGTEMSTGELADAVGQPRNSMAACMAYPLARGALKSRKREDGITMWSLGDGTPVPKPDDFEPDKPLHKVPAKITKPAPLFDNRKPKPVPARDEAMKPITINTTMTTTREPAPVELEQDIHRAKFGAYSDGTFCVQRGTDAIWLTASETAELSEFIAKNNT